MDQRTDVTAQPRLDIPRWEFIALAAALMALNALALDIMLPAMQQIGASLGVADENSRQFIITAYLMGFGGAQLIYGPISDRFGRRGPLLVGLAIYVLAALAASFASSFTLLLVLRFIQGVGAAATRVIAISMVRDRFGGRQMAEIMSLVFMVFMIVPIIAPAIGQSVILFAEWHMIFVAMAALCFAVTVWTMLRMPETLEPERRRAFTPRSVVQGFRIVVTSRAAVCYTAATTFIFGALFGFLNSAQQVYEGIYGLGVMFPVFFAGVAGLMAVSSFLNSRLVRRIGMRRLSHAATLGFLAVSAAWLALSLAGDLPLWQFVSLFGLAMFQFGWIGANFNALAMEPLGHVAGTASSVLGFLQTVGGAVIGAVIGQAFDGTTTPLAASFCLVALIALGFVYIGERGRLFGAQPR